MEVLASGQQLEQLYLPGSQENYTLALNSLEVQVLHDEISSKLFGLDNVYIV